MLYFLKQTNCLSQVIAILRSYIIDTNVAFVWLPFTLQCLGPEIIPGNSLGSELDVFNQQCPFLE